MSALVPPGREFYQRLTTLPVGDVTTPDGRALRRRERYRNTAHSQGAIYDGPGGLLVIASLDNTPQHGVLLHVSLSYRDRDPSWTTIKAVKAAFFGDSDCMMLLPKAADFVNVQSHTFHVWQCPEDWGLQ